MNHFGPRVIDIVMETLFGVANKKTPLFSVAYLCRESYNRLQHVPWLPDSKRNFECDMYFSYVPVIVLLNHGIWFCSAYDPFLNQSL